ncbi:MAG TPA: carbamoyltransferase C-terminal domain-containing protein [Oxalicibacterium sp.]|nr:carbamoyltransferase C-terminal domain-containing protein [Oxalicibacterium sp.]
MYTLGINAAFHDCAACLVKDGVVIAAAEEERFTRIKHGKRPLPFTVWQLPYHAIDYCLQQAGIELSDVAHVAYSYDPFLQLGEHGAQSTISLPLEPSASPGDWESPWQPLSLSYVVNAPRQLANGAPHHIKKRFRNVTATGPYRWHFVEHHLAHEASAFLAAPFDACAVLTVDGRGERATTSYGHFRDGEYRRIKQIDYPQSLGLLYEEITDHLGFLRSSDEYKVMALASYGQPAFLPQLREIVKYEGDGVYSVAKVDWRDVLGPARERGGPTEQVHIDIAHSLQAVLEETVMQMANWLHEQTGSENLAMAGGVALNCVMNAKLRDRGPFKRIWVQPAAGDSGTALGAALWIDREQRQDRARHWQMDHVFLGPGYDDAAIEQLLRETRLPYRRVANIAQATAELLAQNKVVGWFQGRMEYGPRSLGARSILASPIDPDMQSHLNQIKDREDFRPVAPVVLEEEAAEWFVDGGVSPFMLFIYDVRADKAARIPAVRHVDGTARVQTINRSQHPLYYDLLKAFHARTGVPVLVNTSFNTRGEPIVCTPRDALESFCTTPLDVLAIGSFLLEKPSLMRSAHADSDSSTRAQPSEVDAVSA